jgi:membrane dipeptidase
MPPVRRSGLLLLALVVTSGASADAQSDPALERARKILRSVPLIDGHNDLAWEIRHSKTAPRDVAAYDLRGRAAGHTDFERLKAGQVGAQFWSIYVPGEVRDSGYAKVQLEQFDIARRTIARYPDRLALALTAADIEREFKRGRIASLLGMEGGHALENSLGALRAYYDLGVRYMTLTHNVTLDWADAANDTARHGGLTRFGEEVVREMNRLGMLVDLSHTSPETMDDAIRVAEAPVIFSHSSARGVCDVPRNVPDAILRRLPASGGVVMITFVAAFVSPEFAKASAPVRKEYEKRTAGVGNAMDRERIYEELVKDFKPPVVTIGQLADHFDHVRTVAGVDHIGIGADYDGNTDWPAGLEDVSRYPYLFAELIRRGWSDADLKKVAGGNVLRALRGAEATARRLQAARPPSVATLEQMDKKQVRSPGRSPR